MIDPLKNPGRYPTGKNFLTHGLAQAKPVHSVGPTRSDPRKKQNPSKKPIKKTLLKSSRARALDVAMMFLL